MQTLNPTPTTTPQGGGKGLNTKPETHNPPPHHHITGGERGGGVNPKPTTTPQGDERGLNNPRKQPHHPDHPHHKRGGEGSIIGPVRGGNHGGGGGGGRATLHHICLHIPPFILSPTINPLSFQNGHPGSVIRAWHLGCRV